MEQLVARRAHNPKVVSSSLAPATQSAKRYSSENSASCTSPKGVRKKLKAHS